MTKDLNTNDYSDFLNEQYLLQHKSVIQEVLSPKFLSEGAWPKESNISLMEQVFINLTINTTDAHSALTLPSSSKVITLLKEIIAHFVVERTVDIAELTDPTEAFHNNQLDDNLTHFKLVFSTKDTNLIDKIQDDLSTVSKQKIYSLNLKDETININDIIDEKNIIAHLEYENARIDIENEWNTTRIEFLKLLYEIHNQLDTLEKDSEAFFTVNDYDFEQAFKLVIEEENKIQNKKVSHDNRLRHLKTENEEISHSLRDMKTTIDATEQELNDRYSTVLSKLKKLLRGYTKDDQQLENKRDILKKEVSELESIFETNTEEITSKEKELHQIKEDIQEVKHKRKNIMNDKSLFDALKEHHDLSLAPTEELFEQTIDNHAVQAPWITETLEEKRESLFLLALKLQKLLLISNVETIRHILDQGTKKEIFDVVHLIFPFISATDESLYTFYKEQPDNYIDYCLFENQSNHHYNFIQHTINVY